ncbi:MAG: metallophosphoesterase [Planctomycetaceae bacterium]
MYDIIGDIHGHADELVELLSQLGYREDRDSFRHPHRKVVFCGDFIDRGPQIPEAVRIARSMVLHDAALAVMGNHEFNALAYHTEDPENPGQFLRPHDAHNQRQHASTVNQFQRSDLQHALNWFQTLPVALDLGNLRIVHACWSPADLQSINAALVEFGGMTDEFLKSAMTRNSDLFNSVECVLKGPELALPTGVTVTDKEGNVRKRVRIRWFDSPVQRSWSEYALPSKNDLPPSYVPKMAAAVPYTADQPPVFFGHYWLPDDQPCPLKHNVACLDYSIAKGGFLTAYRFDGEQILLPEKFVTVPSRSRGAVE